MGPKRGKGRGGKAKTSALVVTSNIKNTKMKINDDYYDCADEEKMMIHTTPLRGIASIEPSIYSTPQTYPSEIVYCGLGKDDWGISSPANAIQMTKFFLNLSKNQPAVASLPLPLSHNVPSSSKRRNHTLSSNMVISTEDNCFALQNKKKKQDTISSSLGFLISPENSFASCSISPPPLFDCFYNDSKSESVELEIKETEKGSDGRRKHSRYSINKFESVPSPSEKNTSPFFDILNENSLSSFSSTSSLTTTTSSSTSSSSFASMSYDEEEVVHNVAHYFFHSFTNLYPQLFPEIDLFHNLATQYLSNKSSLSSH